MILKLQVVKETIETGKNAVVARRYELNSNMVGRWVREYKNNKSLHGSSMSEEMVFAFFWCFLKRIPFILMTLLISKVFPDLLKASK